MSDCTHDLSERETAVADGYCPMCLVSTAEKLQTRVEELVGLYEKSNDALSAQVKRACRSDKTIEQLKARNKELEEWVI